MQSARELIGMPLLTRTGERAGYIRGLSTDRTLRHIRNAECCDEEEEEFSLPYSAIKPGRDAAMVLTLRRRPCERAVPAPFSRAVYTPAGEFVGQIEDLLADGCNILSVQLSDGRTVSPFRLRAGENCAILLPEREQTPAPAPAPAPAPQEQPPARKNNAGSRLLTGKTLPADLLDARGNVLARRGTVVGAETIRRALANQKLFELTLLCTRSGL